MADKPQSKFWAGSDSGDSDTEESYSSSEEEAPQKQEEKKNWHYESDSSDDDAQRVVKSAKDKAEEAFQKSYTNVKNALNINDWNNIAQLFGQFSNLLTKHADVVQGLKSGSIENYPEYYFLSLKAIQDAITELSKDKASVRKLSKTNGKSFNVLRARMKKLITEEYQNRIDNCEQKVKSSRNVEDSESDSSDDSSDSDSSEETGDKSDQTASEYDSSTDSSSSDGDSVATGKDRFLNDSEWESESDESSSSSEEEGPQLTGRARWVKKVPAEQSKAKAEERKQKEVEKQERAKQRKLQKEAEAERKQKEIVEEEVFTEKIAHEKLDDLMLLRGKKGVNKESLVEQMEVIVDRCEIFGTKFKLPFSMQLIALIFDVKSGLDEYMPVTLWLRCLQVISRILDVVEQNQYILLQYIGEETPDDAENIVRVIGDLSMFVDRLNNEYEKSLRYMENHSEEYVSRLQHEGHIIDLARRVFNYYQRVGQPLKCAMMCVITLQNTFYKHESLAKPVFHAHVLSRKFGPRSFWHPAAIGSENTTLHPAASLGVLAKQVEEDPELIDFSLEQDILADCRFIFQHGTEEMKCLATLSQVFHYALHDKYFKARDLLLMSRLQDTIYSFSVESQILYNRTIAQLGFCAFRQGKMAKCHSCLVDLCQQSTKTKELLAQGVYWRKQVQGMDTKAIEAFQRQERRRLLPFHLHINLDLLEFFHLTAAMILEVPNMALQKRTQHSNSSHNRAISRTFRRYLDQYNKQLFTGPPENTRDHIVLAALALGEGDWKRCSDLLLNLSVWKLFTSRANETKELLRQECKKQGLRTFLIRYCSVYNSLSMAHLESLFELPANEIYKLTNKMIIDDEIKGSWDVTKEGNQVLLLRSNEPTHLQALASRYSTQIEAILEVNERKASKSSYSFDNSASYTGEDGKKSSFKYRKHTNISRRTQKVG